MESFPLYGGRCPRNQQTAQVYLHFWILESFHLLMNCTWGAVLCMEEVWELAENLSVFLLLSSVFCISKDSACRWPTEPLCMEPVGLGNQ